MAEQSIQLRKIAVMFYSGDYKGESPSVNMSGLKIGDKALDTSCSVLWEFTGTKWVRKASLTGGKIYLAGGRSLHEMITSPLTSMPIWMELYEGDDLRVPRDLQLSDKDLVIHHRMGEPPVIMASYYDKSDNHWYGINPPPGAIVTSVDGGWSMWIGFFSVVSPHKSIIRVWDIGSQNSADISVEGGFTPELSPGGGGGTSSPADKLSSDKVDELVALSDKLKVSSTGGLVIIDGEEEHDVKIDRHILLTATTPDAYGKVYIDSVPNCVVTAKGDVFYMNSKFDPKTGKYVLDFSGIDISGVWKVLY